jgi:lipoxygenase homology domain-containing protein 1
MPTYQVRITTAPDDHAGTGADIYIELYGTSGNSGEVVMDNTQDNFEKGKTDTFSFDFPELGELTKIRLRNADNGPNSGWKCDKVIIRNQATGKEWNFPVNQWFAHDVGDEKLERDIPVAG